MQSAHSFPYLAQAANVKAAPPTGDKATNSKKGQADALVDDEDEPMDRRQQIRLAIALTFLILIAVLKTLLTKLVFIKLPGIPVAFSALSCVATMIWLLPIFACRPDTWHMLKMEMVPSLSIVWLSAGVDLGCMNTAFAELSVAMAQTLRAASPVVTIIVETAYTRVLYHPAIYMSLVVLVMGTIISKAGSSAYDANWYGITMMLIGLCASSAKYVFSKASLDKYKTSLGPFSFLFWMEVGILCLLIPWCLLNGELAQLMRTPDSAGAWVLIWCSAALGGVRALSQIFVLGYASATTLSASNLGIQALTILISFPVFHTEPTSLLLTGVAVTTLGSAAYAVCKTLKLPKSRLDCPCDRAPATALV